MAVTCVSAALVPRWDSLAPGQSQPTLCFPLWREQGRQTLWWSCFYLPRCGTEDKERAGGGEETPAHRQPRNNRSVWGLRCGEKEPVKHMKGSERREGPPWQQPTATALSLLIGFKKINKKKLAAVRGQKGADASHLLCSERWQLGWLRLHTCRDAENWWRNINGDGREARVITVSNYNLTISSKCAVKCPPA